MNIKLKKRKSSNKKFKEKKSLNKTRSKIIKPKNTKHKNKYYSYEHYLNELNYVAALRDKDIKKLSILSAIFILLIFTFFMFFISSPTHNNLMTGFVVLNNNSNTTLDINLQSQLELNTIEDKLISNPFISLISKGYNQNMKLCLIVPYDETNYKIYEVNKNIEGIKVISNDVSNINSPDFYCGGLDTNDLTIKFISYNSFEKILSSTSYNEIISGKGGVDYYILPSNHLENGGNVECTEEFINKYCGVVNSISYETGTSENELIEGDLSCCIRHPLTKEQKELLKQHIENNPNFYDETGIVERETQNPMSNEGYWFITLVIIVIVIFLTIAIIVFILKHKQIEKKIAQQKLQREEQVKQYIQNAKQKGYSDEQIKESLKKVGWNDDQISKFF